MNNFENKDKNGHLIAVETETVIPEMPHVKEVAETDERQRTSGNDNEPLAEHIDDISFINSSPSIASKEKVLEDELIEVSEATTYGSGIVHSVGYLLCNARQEHNMSVDDVSRQLRLSVQQVEAIEKDNHEKLPERVFIRGFIRNYANLVKLDAASIIQLLPDQSPVVSPIKRTPFKIKEISFSSSQDKDRNTLVFSVVALIFFALIVYLVFPDDDGWNKSEERINTPVELDTGQITMPLDFPLPSSSTSQDGRDQLVYKDPVSALNILGRLNFKFLEDAQVQVIDGGGDAIFDQNNAGDSVQMIRGKRPLFVVIHNAAGVELTYNDRSIEIQPYTNERDGIARFTLE